MRSFPHHFAAAFLSAGRPLNSPLLFHCAQLPRLHGHPHVLQSITLGGLFSVMSQLVKARRLIIVGCGTSWHAGLLGEYLIEGLTRIPV